MVLPVRRAQEVRRDQRDRLVVAARLVQVEVAEVLERLEVLVQEDRLVAVD